MNENDIDASVPEKIPFQEVLAALLDVETPFAARYLYRLSDLIPAEIRDLEKIWGQIPTWRRKALLEDLEQLFGDDYLLSFEAIGRLALKDPEEEIRFLGLRSLFEYEVKDLIPMFLNLLTNDSYADMRAAAATALGKYIYEGEVEELDPKTLRLIEDRLMSVFQGTDATLVRRRALEALGFSSRKELPTLIETAFNTREGEWIVSALFAMGRSCDKRWEEPVVEMLDHVLPDVRLEAARAAGEIEISAASDRLIELLDDDNDEVRLAAAWSLSQIGGDDVQEALDQMLDNAEIPEEIDFIESAIDNLIFNQSVQFYGIMGLPKSENEAEDDLDFDHDDFDDDLDDFDEDDNEEYEY